MAAAPYEVDVLDEQVTYLCANRESGRDKSLIQSQISFHFDPVAPFHKLISFSVVNNTMVKSSWIHGGYIDNVRLLL